ncbi:P-loop containing nucleoside triphosphate hydrolase protein [Syncephalis fuscata]|nr:P-loop containing nucleoside triphosphate hydrolase protein [Syncephalis fuscata]
MGSHQRGDSLKVALSCHDLATINPAPTSATIVNTLKDRYSRDAIYTRIGARVLVAVNPNQPLSSSNDATCMEYIAEYRDTSGQRRILEPHLFQMASSAYMNMRRTATDQSIILCGETETKLLRQVLSAFSVIEAFGHATTTEHGNASRVGTFTELAFNERGKAIGAKILDYALNKSRVIDLLQNERNFNVFYQMAGGCTLEERQRWKLSEPANLSYLGKLPATRSPTAQDAIALDELRVAMRAFGINKKTQGQVFRCLAAILHLGNILFTDPPRKTTEESAYVRNDDVLAITAELLGIHAKALEGVLTYKTQLIKSEMCTLFLSAEQCERQRDDLARSIYGLLFTWLMEQINTKLHNEETQTSFIGVLDMIGYRADGITRRGGTGGGLNFEALISNFTCERLHSFALQQLFTMHSDDMTADGIPQPNLAFIDNKPCVDLFSKTRRGLFALMDKESARSSNPPTGATDKQFLQAFTKVHGNHNNFLAVPNRHNAFAIQHYAGQVTYDMNRFPENNADVLIADFVQLFLGNGDDLPGSANPFMTSLFEGKSVKTEVHARDAGIIVSARHSAKPTRSPSTRRKQRANTAETDPLVDDDDDDDNDSIVDGGKGADTKDKKKKNARAERRANRPAGIGTQVCRAINELTDTLSETLPWFVFCIRPNDQRKANNLDLKHVRAQMQYFHLEEVVRRSEVSYTVNMTHTEFLDRYALVLTPTGVDANRDPRAKCQATCDIFAWTPREMAVGARRVWLAHEAWRDLEDNLRATEVEARRRKQAGGAAAGTATNPHHSIGASMADDNASVYSGMTTYGAGGGLQLLDTMRARSAAPSVFTEDVQSAISDDDGAGPHHPMAMDVRAMFAPSVVGDRASVHPGQVEYISPDGSEGDAAPINKDSNEDQAKENILGEEEEEEQPKMTKQRKRWLCCTWSLTWWIPSFCLSFNGMKRKDIQIAWREKVALCLLITIACLIMLFFIIFFGKLICPHQNIQTLLELQSTSNGTSSQNAFMAIRGEVFDIRKFPAHHTVTYNDIIKSGKYAGQDASTQFPQQVSTQCDGFEENGVDNTIALQNYTVPGSSEYAHDFRWWKNPSANNVSPDTYSIWMEMMRRSYRVALVGWDAKYIKSQAQVADKKWAIIDQQVFDLTDYLKGNVFRLTPDGTVASPSIERKFMDPRLESLFMQNPGEDVSKLFRSIFRRSADARRRMETCLRNLFFVGVVDYRNSFRCQFANYMLLSISILLVAVIFFKFLAALQLTGRRDPEEHDRFVVCQVPCYTEGEDSLKETIDSLAVMRYDDKRKLLFVICDGMIVGSGNDQPTPRIVLNILGSDPNIDPEPLSFISLGDGMKQHNMGKVYTGLYECSGHVVPYMVVVKVGRPNERARPGNRGKQLEMYHQIKNVIGVDPNFYEYVLMVDADTVVLPDALNRMVSAMLHDQKIMGICGETELANAKATWITMIQVYEYYISHHMSKAFESLFGSVTCLPGCFCMYRLRAPHKDHPLLINNAIIDEYSENRVDTLHKKNLLSLGEDRYLTTLLLKHFPTMKTSFTSDAQCRTKAPDTWSILLSQRRRWINSTVHNLVVLLSLDRLCGFCCFSMRFVVFVDLLATIIQPATVVYLAYLAYMGITQGSVLIFVSLMMLAAIYGLQAIIFLLKRGDQGGKKHVAATEGEKFDPRTIPRKKWTDYEQELWESGSQDSHATHQSRQSRAPTVRSYRSRASIHSQRSQAAGGNGGGARSVYAATIHGNGSVYNGQMSGQSYAGSVHQRPFSGYSTVSVQHHPQHPSIAYHDPPASVYGGTGTEFSYAASPHPAMPMMSTPSRPTSIYNGGGNESHYAGSVIAGMAIPTDDEILAEVRRILAHADLMTVTKKQVRDALSSVFGTDMQPRKEYINQCIEHILQGRL